MAKKDLHILILSSWYPTEDHPFLGNFVERQAGLLALKYKVTVLHTSVGESKSIVVKETLKPNFREINVQFGGNVNSITRKFRERAALLHGLKLIESADLIIGNVLLPKGWLFLIAQKKFRCPLFYIEHGSFFRPDLKSTWTGKDKWLLNNIAKSAKVVIAVSDTLKFDMAPFFPKHEIKVIGNHVDTALFYPKSKIKQDKTEFLHVSTLDKNTKNPEGIFKAVELLSNETIDFNLTVICDEDTSEWEAMVNERKLDGCIQFVGPLQWAELLPYYHRADAFVLFSEYETFSIVLAEALSTGTPIISTPVGIAAKLSPCIGLLVRKNDSDDLKNKMLQVIDNKTEFDSEDIINESSKYSETTILDEWVKIIDIHVG